MERQVQDLSIQNQQLAAELAELRVERDQFNTENVRLQQLVGEVRRENQQEVELMQSEVIALREQLQTAHQQIVRLKDRPAPTADPSPQVADSGTQATRTPYATVRDSNSSLRNNVPTYDNLPDVHVRYDGDVVRIELPADRLFATGDAQLVGSAEELRVIALDIARRYPQQRIGIEGHSDKDELPRGSRYTNNHHLSSARATTVLDFIQALNTPLRAEQLFVVGYGGSQPVVSNATPEGKRRNRRVEIVIYPERAG
jgi:flagellar motor protein MotB